MVPTPKPSSSNGFVANTLFINYLGVHEAVRQQHEADGAGKEDAAAFDGPDPAHVLPVGHAEQVHVVQGPTQTHNHHRYTCSINDVRFEVLP